MLDLNLNDVSADPIQNGEPVLLLEKLSQGSGNQMDESGTSNSSIVNAEASSNGGDDDSCSTRAGGEVLTFNFDILKEGRRNDVITQEFFPISGAGGDIGNGQGDNSLTSSSGKNWIDLAFKQSGSGSEVRGFQPQQQQPMKKSRRGPRSRSSQYRGVTFYRRTGRWESHIWDCGKQVYLGGFDTAHAAARAYDRAAIKFRGVEADINFNLSDYDDDLKQMKNLTKEEYVHILRRQSTGFSRGSSKYRGVTLHKCGRWEARMGQFLGKKAYDKAAIKCNGREAVTNFEPSTYEGEMISESSNRGGEETLDLNLGIAPPSLDSGPKEIEGHVQFQPSPCFVRNTRTPQMESQSIATPGNSPLNGPFMTSEHPTLWNGVYPNFFPNEERVISPSEKRIPICSSSQVIPNWEWKMQHGQVSSTQMPLFSTAASSGFSFSTTTITTLPPYPPSPAAFHLSNPSSSAPKNLCFTSAPPPLYGHHHYPMKPPQAPS